MLEYKKHASLNPDKVINWYVDNEGLKLFLNSTNGTEKYCYIHSGSYDTLPYELKEHLNEDGEVLGVYEKKEPKPLPVFGGNRA